MAELGGSVSGLAEAAQLQLRRGTSMSDRLRELRLEVDGIGGVIDGRIKEVAEQQHETTSKCRFVITSLEDMQRSSGKGMKAIEDRLVKVEHLRAERGVKPSEEQEAFLSRKVEQMERSLADVAGAAALTALTGKFGRLEQFLTERGRDGGAQHTVGSDLSGLESLIAKVERLEQQLAETGRDSGAEHGGGQELVGLESLIAKVERLEQLAERGQDSGAQHGLGHDLAGLESLIGKVESLEKQLAERDPGSEGQDLAGLESLIGKVELLEQQLAERVPGSESQDLAGLESLIGKVEHLEQQLAERGGDASGDGTANALDALASKFQQLTDDLNESQAWQELFEAKLGALSGHEDRLDRLNDLVVKVDAELWQLRDNLQQPAVAGASALALSLPRASQAALPAPPSPEGATSPSGDSPRGAVTVQTAQGGLIKQIQQLKAVVPAIQALQKAGAETAAELDELRRLTQARDVRLERWMAERERLEDQVGASQQTEVASRDDGPHGRDGDAARVAVELVELKTGSARFADQLADIQRRFEEHELSLRQLPSNEDVAELKSHSAMLAEQLSSWKRECVTVEQLEHFRRTSASGSAAEDEQVHRLPSRTSCAEVFDIADTNDDGYLDMEEHEGDAARAMSSEFELVELRSTNAQLAEQISDLQRRSEEHELSLRQLPSNEDVAELKSHSAMLAEQLSSWKRECVTVEQLEIQLEQLRRTSGSGSAAADEQVEVLQRCNMAVAEQILELQSDRISLEQFESLQSCNVALAEQVQDLRERSATVKQIKSFEEGVVQIRALDRQMWDLKDRSVEHNEMLSLLRDSLPSAISEVQVMAASVEQIRVLAGKSQAFDQQLQLLSAKSEEQAALIRRVAAGGGGGGGGGVGWSPASASTAHGSTAGSDAGSDSAATLAVLDKESLKMVQQVVAGEQLCLSLLHKLGERVNGSAQLLRVLKSHSSQTSSAVLNEEGKRLLAALAKSTAESAERLSDFV